MIRIAKYAHNATITIRAIQRTTHKAKYFPNNPRRIQMPPLLPFWELQCRQAGTRFFGSLMSVIPSLRNSPFMIALLCAPFTANR